MNTREPNSSERTSGTGGAKLLLFGEHSAVYGFPAVGIGLPERLTVTITVGAGQAGDRWDFSDAPEAYRQRLVQLAASAESELPELVNYRYRVTIESEIQPDVGFGSSGALCVGFAEAVLTLWTTSGNGGESGPARPEGVSRARVWKLAHHLERVFHGTPSGIDTGLATFGGLRIFRPSPPGLPSANPLQGVPFHFVAGYVEREQSTAELVGALRERMVEGDTAVTNALSGLGEIAAESLLLFSGPPRIPILDPDDPTRVIETPPPTPPPLSVTAAHFGELANRAHSLLSGLGLSSRTIEAALRAGRESGATGGKLSGAGGGGAFFLAVPDEQTLRQVGASVTAFAVRVSGFFWDGNHVMRVEKFR